MSDLNYEEFFENRQVDEPEHFNRYRRGLTLSSLLIITILAGGLEFFSVSTGGLGLRISRGWGMHAVVLAVFAFYWYAYSVVRRKVLLDLEKQKEQTLWDEYIKWVISRQMSVDFRTALGSQETLPMNYSNETWPRPKKEVGVVCSVESNRITSM